MVSGLELTLLLLGSAVLGVVAFRMLHLPPMLGYLAVGIVIGPNAMALAKDSAAVSYLAEFGVVFLMFVIGLEFNLPKLRSMRRLVFGLEELWTNQLPTPLDGTGEVNTPAGRQGATQFTTIGAYNQAGACLLVAAAPACSQARGTIHEPPMQATLGCCR